MTNLTRTCTRTATKNSSQPAIGGDSTVSISYVMVASMRSTDSSATLDWSASIAA